MDIVSKIEESIDGEESTELVEKSGLSSDQEAALEMLLSSNRNVFLTGPAGSGKSFVIREWRSRVTAEEFPILASTGAAAVLVGGRTFHSFFGLGIMEGGPSAVLEKAMKDSRLKKRLRTVKGFLIDEISMISGEALAVADLIARHAREEDSPWGGLRVIAVGDFAQLPPVSRFGQGNSQKRDWCFLSETWQQSEFLNIELKINHRVKDSEFLKLLSCIRNGEIGANVKSFLDSKLVTSQNAEKVTAASSCPFLYSRRDLVDGHNQKELAKLPGEMKSYPSIFFTVQPGNNRNAAAWEESLKKNVPVRDVLEIKQGCRVLLVQNDPQKRWVNGTRGIVKEMKDDCIIVQKEQGRTIKVERVSFSLMNAEGEVLATLLSFPMILAYAVTIHKSQGMTLSGLCTDLRRLWEPGQAYVALSRLQNSEQLYLSGWQSSSFIIDPEVVRFYKQMHYDK